MFLKLCLIAFLFVQATMSLRRDGNIQEAENIFNMVNMWGYAGKIK